MRNNLMRFAIPAVIVLVVITTSICISGAEELIKKDDTGEQVYALQSALYEAGYLESQPDGIFGEYTCEAVMTFQEEYGLDPAGDADQETIDVLSCLNNCIQTDPEAEPVRSVYLRNVGINVYEDGRYFVEPNTVSNSNMELAHEFLTAVTKAYNESTEIPEQDLIAALYTDDPEVPLIFIRDIPYDDLPDDGTMVCFYDIDSLEPEFGPVEMSAEEMKFEQIYVFRNIQADTDNEGNIYVVPNTVSSKSLEETRKIYTAVKHAFLTSNCIPEDEVVVVQIDTGSLPEGITIEDTVYDEASGSYYIDSSLVNGSYDLSGLTKGIIDSSGDVAIVVLSNVQPSYADYTYDASDNGTDSLQEFIEEANRRYLEYRERNEQAASQANSGTNNSGTDNDLEQSFLPDETPEYAYTEGSSVSDSNHQQYAPASGEHDKTVQNMAEPEDNSVINTEPENDSLQQPISGSEPASTPQHNIQPGSIYEQPTQEPLVTTEPVTEEIRQPETIAEPETNSHIHEWQAVYKVVHHDAVTHQEPVYRTVHHEAITHEEQVYEQIWVDEQVVQGEFLGYKRINIGCCICHTCGEEYVTYEEYHAHTVAGGGWCDSDGYRTGSYYIEDTSQPVYDQIYVPGHYDQIGAGLQTVVDQAAYDEQVLDGYITVTDLEAYDEQVVDYYICYGCGATK